MNSLKRILSVIMVLAMLLSCMGAAPFEAVAGQTEQEGVTVSDMIEVENVPSEPESAAEPAEETEPAAEPAEGTEPAAESAEETEPAAEPAEGTEPAAEPVAEPEATAEPAEAMTLSLENGIMPIAEPAPPANSELVEATWSGAAMADGITYDGQPIDNTTDIKAEYTEGVSGEPTYTYVDAAGNKVENPTDAGTYTVTATWEKDGGSGTVYDTQEFTIKRAPLTVTINGGTFTQDYKGSEYTIEELSISDVNVTGTQNSETVTAEAVFWDSDGKELTDPIIDAKTYNIGYKLTYGNGVKEANYEVKDFEPKTLTINKATATLTLQGGTVTVDYTGVDIVLDADKFTDPTLAEGDTLKSVTLADTADAKAYNNPSAQTIMATRGSELTDVTANYDPITLTGTLTVNQVDLKDATVTITPTSVPYNGDVQELTPVVKLGDVTLTSNNYDVSYEPENPTNPGDVTVTVTAKGSNVTGTNSVKYTITKLDINSSNVTVKFTPPANAVYTIGQKFEPTIELTYKKGSAASADEAMDLGTDYTVSYQRGGEATEDFTSSGKIDVIITGTGNFTGTANKSYTIAQKPMTDPTITVDPIDPVVYTGSAQTPAPVVKDGGETLSVGTDYDVAYADNTDAGTATVTITGKGNYKDVKTAEFTINKKSLGDGDVTVEFDHAEMTYTGSALTQNVTVKYNGMTLKNTTDYTLTWDNNVNVGSGAKVTVTAVENGNYKDSTERTFTISPRALTADGMSVSDIENVVYNGASQTPEPVVKDGEKTLLKGTDYTLEYSENTTDVGTVTVTVTGAGNYAAEGVTVEKTYDITQKGITKADGVTVTAPDDVVYDGAAHALDPVSVIDEKVPQDRQALKEDRDYTLSWSGEKDDDKVTDAGTVTITVSGKGNYTGTNSDATYAIRPQNIKKNEADWQSVVVDDPATDTVYDGQTHQWVPKLTFTKDGVEGAEMVKDTDYTVEYTRDDGMEVTDAKFFIDVGTITVTITGINNFTGTVVKSYSILQKSLDDEDVTVELKPTEMTYTGSALMPTVTVTYNGMTLAENTDYSLSWENNINVGSEAKVTLTAVENGNYKDSTVRTFTILPRALTAEGMSVSDIENVVYNGKSQMPEPVVEDGGKTLLEGTDYTLEYSENTTDVGTVTVTVTGAGNYAVEGVTVTKTYNITQKGITAADGVTVVAPDGVVYDGAAHAQKPTSVVDANVPQDRQALKEGIDYTLSWSGEKDDDKVTAAGTVTITVTGTGNYKDENSDATYAIRPQNIEEGGTDWLSVAVDDPIAETVYDSQAHQWEPQLTFTKAGEKDTAMVKDTDYTVEYTRDDGMEVTDARFFKDVGTITVTIKGINNFTGTVVKSYKITKQPVTVKAAGAKLFGAVDPKFAIGATAEEAAIHNADNWLMVTFEGIIPGEETLFDGKGGDDVLSVTTAVRDQGEDKEQPGKYDIDVTVDDTKAANYAVTVDPNENAFTISDTAAFTVTLGDTERSDDIDTHTVGQVKYDIIANPRQTLISDLQSYINVALLVDVTEVAGNYVAPDAPDAQTKNVPESIAQDDRTDTEADADKTGKFTIPAIAYSAQHEGASPLTWHSGLPAGTKLTVKIESSKDAVSTVISPETVTVVAKAADMGSEYAAGTGKNAFLDGEPSVNGRVVLDASGTVTILPADGKEFIGADDWITLTVGEKTYHYSVNAYSELLGGAAPAADGTLVLNLNMLKALAGVSGEEGGWFGANPTGKLTVSAVVFDGVNHTVGTTTLYVAFDTGAVDSTQTVENRITAETLQLAITDSVNAAPNVAANGQFGGASITEDIAAVGGAAGTLTWNNVTKWMQTPETLPHSGNTITITYLDCVGNQVNHTLTVVRSAAVTSNTLYVQPMKNDTVPGKSLTFYGETNAWEQGVLTVGGTSFPVEPIAGSERYDNGTKRWQVVVNLGDINFPVGEPTTVSMAYEDLNGGEATIRITYKDQAQTPILSSEPIVGSQAFWGYVESGATVSVSVYHADGTVTQIPQDNIAVDQFGYFYVRLSSPLEEGEQIVVSTSDFCDNQKSFTVNVQKELKADAKAEVLGANIIGELMGTSNIQHRFATPIDLGALDQAENKTMTLPILAYKSIEVGKITFSLQTPGKMNVSYNIKATNSIPVGGAARMKTFGTKPTIDELVSGELSTVVKDLKTSPAGSMPAIDVSAYQAEDGTYGGIVWLQFEFDVDMTEDNFVSRGGRDARFYRWLTESLQSESLLGAVYQETAAYEENVGYYNQYQKFENTARMN